MCQTCTFGPVLLSRVNVVEDIFIVVKFAYHKHFRRVTKHKVQVGPDLEILPTDEIIVVADPENLQLEYPSKTAEDDPFAFV